MDIRIKIIIMNIFSLIVFSMAVLILNSSSVRTIRSQWDKNINTLPNQQEVSAKNIISFSMKELLVLYNRGNITGDIKQAKDDFFKLISNIRYNNGKGYVWIVDYEGNIIFNPAFPDMVGKNLNNIKYTKNSGIVKKIQTIVDSEGGIGSFKYSWPEPGSVKAIDKIGFLNYFEPYNWIVISDLYPAPINEQKIRDKIMISKFLKNQTLLLSIITVIIMAIVVILSILLSRRILKPIKDISEDADRMSTQVAEGEFVLSLNPDAKFNSDEIGRMQLALYKFYSVLRDKLVTIQSHVCKISSASESYPENSNDLKENLQKAFELGDTLKDTTKLLKDRSSKMPHLADSINKAVLSINKLSASLPSVTHEVSGKFVTMSAALFSIENLHQLFLNQIKMLEKIVKAIDFILDSSSKLSFSSKGSNIAIEETMRIIGKLAKTHTKTKDNIKDALSKIKNETDKITDIMDSMAAGKKEMELAMNDLNSRIDKFNDQTSLLNEPIKQLSDNCNIINKIHQKLDDYSSSLKVLLANSVKSINFINGSIDSLKVVVEELSKIINIR